MLFRSMSYVLGTYARTAKDNFVKGKGCYLYTDKGEKYLDFVQGIAVNALGHNHEHLVKTMKSQADKPWHISNLFLIQEQEKFANNLAASVIPGNLLSIISLSK